MSALTEAHRALEQHGPQTGTTVGSQRALYVTCVKHARFSIYTVWLALDACEPEPLMLWCWRGI